MVGQNIGKYRVLDRVGRGGMGTVYRAIDETLHREVAIKVLNAELNDPEVARRFRAEAITVARLSHPGIATIYELFQHDGQWLMVMEFVRGETLEHLIAAQGALPPGRAAQLCMQSLAALAHAHSMGVVHRDLKPANVMLTDGGDIKIMDFGIARVSGTEHLTNVGFMMGTPAYMAPEQVLGQEIDARADLYAMGVVLYRLLAAQLPFKGDTPFAMAQAQVNNLPTPISTVRAGLPPWVEDVMERSLAKKPEDRFQSAVEFHDALERALSGEPAPARYRSSAPSGLVSTPSRPMPTGSIEVTALSTSPSTPFDRTEPPTPAVAFDPASMATTMAATPITLERPVVPAASVTAATTPEPAAPLPPVPVPVPSSTVSAPAAGAAAVASVKAGSASRPSLSGRTLGLAAAGVVLLVLLAGVWWAFSRPSSPAPALTAELETTLAEAEEPPAPEAQIEPPPDSVTPPTVETPPASVTVPSPRSPAASAGSTSRAATSGETRAEPAPEAPAARTAEPPAATTAALPPVEVTNVKVMIVDGRDAKDEDVTLDFASTQIRVVGVRAGSAIAALPYSSIAAATYVRARNPRWDTAFSSPPNNLDVGGVFRGARHWLMLQGTDSYLLFRLEDVNVIRVIREVEARTGLQVRRP